MNRFFGAACALSLSASGALAGGIDRSGQFIGFLFENGGESGGHVQFSAGHVDPSAVSAGVNDPLGSYSPFSFAFKQNVNDKLSFGMIADQPFGARVAYTNSALAGGAATVDSEALTFLARYKLGNGFSIHGGLRAQQSSGTITTRFGAIPARLSGSASWAVAPVIGVAYERPDIAMSIALTYSGALTNNFTGTENFTPTTWQIKWPESLNLEFQTGIAANTLVFGSIRHVRWAGLNLTTAGAGAGLGGIPRTYVNFTGNTTTYSLGVGRKFNETWSGAVTFGYEAPGTRPTTTALAPTTGTSSVGVGVTYTSGNAKLTAGVTYAKLGNQTFAGGAFNWNDNKAIGAGLRLGFDF